MGVERQSMQRTTCSTMAQERTHVTSLSEDSANLFFAYNGVVHLSFLNKFEQRTNSVTWEYWQGYKSHQRRPNFDYMFGSCIMTLLLLMMVTHSASFLLKSC
jgi:alpha-galactosidase/6-phospho-beta-glucosidase family protein